MKNNKVNIKDIKLSLNNIILFSFTLIILYVLFLGGSENCYAADEFDINQYSKRIGVNTVIHLPKGTYYISKPIELASDTILEGEGSDTVLTYKAPYIGSKFITNKDHRYGNKNITLRSLSIEFDATTLKDDSPGIIRFENVDQLNISHLKMSVKSSLFSIDIASYCRNVIIEHCNIVNYGSGGCLMVRNSDKNAEHSVHSIIVRYNTLQSMQVDEAIAVYGWLGNVNTVTVHDNKIYATYASYGISVFGIEKAHQTGSISNVTVRDNEITGSKTGGIGVKGGAVNIFVTGNRISMCKGDGVFIHAGASGLPKVSGVTIENNIINNIGRHGIFATGYDVVINSNKIDKCKQSGVYVGDNVKVTNNEISNASPGIYVEGKVNRIVQGNILTNASINLVGGDKNGIVDNVIR